MRNCNNVFILRDKKMADFKCQQFGIGLKFLRWSFTEHNNFSKGSFQPKKYAQVIRVGGGGGR